MTELAHFTAVHGDQFVHTVTPKDIRTFLVAHRGEYGAVTLNGWLRTLRVCLEDAVTDGLLAKNPARLVEAFPTKRTKGKRSVALTVKEFRALLRVLRTTDVVSQDIARMIETLMWTAMRKGELLALQAVDIADGELSVQRAVWKRIEGPTKTDDPRFIAIPAPLAELFEKQRQWLLSTQHPGLESGLLFPANPKHARAGASRRKVSALSWYRSPSLLDKPLTKVCALAGVRGVSPHAFRRSCERMLREAGIDDMTRRALAGWRTEDAQEIYSEVDSEERKAAAERLVAFVLAGTPAGTPGVEKENAREAASA